MRKYFPYCTAPWITATYVNKSVFISAHTLRQYMSGKMGYSRKKQTGRLMTCFFEIPLDFFIFLLCPWKSQTKQNSTSGNSTNFGQIPWKFQVQKSRPLEIPHHFFLVTLGNFTLFLIKPFPHAVSTCYSTCYFFDTPSNSISSTPLLPLPLPLFGFFLEQPKKYKCLSL